MSNSPSTKLLIASEEIREILKKHDVAGIICLHTIGCGHYYLHTNTSYSCAYQIEEDEIRISAKREDFNSKEEHTAKIANTANMFEILKKCAGSMFMCVEGLSEKFDDISGAEHHNI